MTNENQLISILVLSYKSSATIVETLESIKRQTYQNIELIITDDCSPDDSVIVCEKWLAENESRFVRTELIKSEINTGTSANINRGIKKCQGGWIKTIAGDDLLLESCIEDNVTYVNNHRDCQIVISKLMYLGDERNISIVKDNFKYDYFLLDKNAFCLKLLQNNFIPAPTAFVKTALYKEIGLYDETIPLMEDWPFWMKACKNGCHFSFMDKETAVYRVGDSISLSANKSKRYIESELRCKRLALSYLKEENLWLWFISYFKYLKYKHCL